MLRAQIPLLDFAQAFAADIPQSFAATRLPIDKLQCRLTVNPQVVALRTV